MVDQSVTKCPERPISGDCVPGMYLQQLQSIQNIATKTKHLMDSRLAELISETERLLAKIKDGVSLTMEDMEFLKGTWEKTSSCTVLSDVCLCSNLFGNCLLFY
ncbi:hypothetical protein DPMN_079332 [Dreissena polymorpha]|uniref:Uncharacterized protein n=1 Tax=Dreissena polymorpha TaxID=45954 RepID=A0A9D3YTK6_DREPO|nr:hypothetical protein DPMN_079332 [Dreissena polymorpha]